METSHKNGRRIITQEKMFFNSVKSHNALCCMENKIIREAGHHLIFVLQKGARKCHNEC